MNKLILLFLLFSSNAYSAMYFNGSDQHVNLPNSPVIQITTPVTVCQWIKITAYPAAAACTFTNNQTNFATYSGIWFTLAPTGEANINTGNNTAGGSTGRKTKAGTTKMQLNRWYSVICVIRTPLDMSIYIDGVDDGGTYSGTASNLLYNPALVGRLGNQAIAANWDYTGYLDDIRLYNRELSYDEIQSLAQSRSRIALTEGLVAWWKLDDGEVGKTTTTGNSVNDFAGGGINGTPVGATWGSSDWINYP